MDSHHYAKLAKRSHIRETSSRLASRRPDAVCLKQSYRVFWICDLPGVVVDVPQSTGLYIGGSQFLVTSVKS